MTNYTEQQMEAVRYALSGFVKYNPKLVPICGSVNAVILYMELQTTRDYFFNKNGSNEFYQTDKQLQEKLGFGRYQLDNAKKELLERQLINCKVIGFTKKSTHYVIHVDKFLSLLIVMLETSISKCWKPASRNAGNQHLYNEKERSNKQDQINKINNNKPKAVDNSEIINNAEEYNSCGAVNLRVVSNYGNRTGLYLRLKEINGLSDKTIKNILLENEEYEITNVLDYVNVHKNNIKTNIAAYITGTLKKVKEDKKINVK